MTLSAAEIAGMIDHTLLKPEATGDQVDKLCDEAVEHGFRSICVNPVFVERVAQRLDAARLGPPKRPAVNAVAGFPLGASLTPTKADEAARAAEQAEIAGRIAQLTGRELEVFEAIVAGASNKAVALKLAISPRTVEIYRANVMSKMQAQSLSDLVRMALTRR